MINYWTWRYISFMNGKKKFEQVHLFASFYLLRKVCRFYRFPYACHVHNVSSSVFIFSLISLLCWIWIFQHPLFSISIFSYQLTNYVSYTFISFECVSTAFFPSFGLLPWFILTPHKKKNANEPRNFTCSLNNNVQRKITIKICIVLYSALRYCHTVLCWAESLSWLSVFNGIPASINSKETFT